MDKTLTEGLRRLRGGDRDIEDLMAGRFETVLALLNGHIEEIELFNAAYGLVAVRDRRELVLKHILDSLAALGVIHRLINGGGLGGGSPPEIADAGSGAGLPGIPLAAALPRCRFTLIERSGRRAGFLRNTLAVLGLSNAAAAGCEIERAPGGRFALVVFRALRPLDTAILGSLFRLLRPGGVLAAYKGKKDTFTGEMARAEQFFSGKRRLLGGWESFPTPVPFLDEERHLVVIRPAEYTPREGAPE
jgi:16S rRNA (guanine527-N7)-methyltransferase